ncbi:hypothetical protein A9264_15850 [Vibrio sp. UCD-FRSSP16_10]|uniref:hypothetical protein n=1 Tax=unclassified Vibrio TaxID=2614977 RepID=UPI0007FC2CFD|nr:MULTISPECIES: hypothetical protein [unclassified Vibrio]OBT12745.1 hypothetical protein A9260_15860 [Vibrio sp. UCD-FRSSP16_30]OBT18198.1 hypothetical protein A9264_15850 [Vibrio sp. UCD-FRSSP16_10]
MNQGTTRQVKALMSHTLKPGIPYRKKRLNRLLRMLDDIFEHEPYLGERLESLGRNHMIGYWRRTEHESQAVRKEKYQVLLSFVEYANLNIRVPIPKDVKRNL